MKHPQDAKKLLRPVVVERPIYSLERAVDFALKSGYIRGQKYDAIGTILGFLEAVKYLDRAGNSVVIDDWLRFHGELTGYVDEETRRLGPGNGYRMVVTPLRNFKGKLKDYGFENADNLEGRLAVQAIASNKSRTIDVILPGERIMVNGRNLKYSAARGDSVTASWTDADGEQRTVRLEPEWGSGPAMDLGIPEALANLTAGTEVTFTFRLHVGAAEDAPEQVARRTVRVG
ncbi:MAG TPA: hypothetical protein DDY72_03505 [Verrucomicrobia bacterium]|nr:hypothetical protein [Verrucomicrobiota bacterium]